MADNEYGSWGQACYDSWVRKYEMIAKDVRFGGADPEEAFTPLKVEINDEINKQFANRQKRLKLGFIMIAVSFVISILAAYMQIMAVGYIMLASYAFTVWCFASRISCRKTIHAAIEFDKKYFEGEIWYRRTHG